MFKYKVVIVLVLLIIFNILLLIFLSSNNKVSKPVKTLTPVDPDFKGEDHIAFVMFYTKWCKYSKMALPDFTSFKEWVDNEKKGKLDEYNIEALMIDVEEPNLSDREKKILEHAKPMIDGYPTLLTYVGNPRLQAYKYNGDRTKEAYISNIESYAS